MKSTRTIDPDGTIRTVESSGGTYLQSPDHEALQQAASIRQSEIGWLAWSHEVEARSLADRAAGIVKRPTFVRILSDGRCASCGQAQHGLTACAR